jgi:hypothetical protein
VSPTAPSRGLEIRLDQNRRTAQFVAEYSHGKGFDADYMGSSQRLPGGGAFVGWGSQPFMTLYDRSGKAVFDAVLPRPDLSYRATIHNWVGLPLYPPVGVARNHGGRTTVYASWNGATEVASWRVLAGTGGGDLRPVATAGKLGFETAVALRQSYKAFKLQALNADGRVIGTSRLFAAGG